MSDLRARIQADNMVLWRNGGTRRKISRKNDLMAAAPVDPTNADAESRQAELDTENGGEVTPVEDSADEYEDWFVPYQDDGVDDGLELSALLTSVERDRTLTKAIAMTTANVQGLSLRYYLLGCNQVKTLVRHLLENETIVSLDLCGCLMMKESIYDIAELIRHNGTIVDLDLSQNCLKSDGMLVIANSLKVNRMIRTLKLNEASLKDCDAFHICSVIEDHHALTELSLSGNHFSMGAGAYFASTLHKDISLTALDLSWNKLRLDGAVLLIHGVQGNKSLKQLSLAWNGLGIVGSKAMARCLQHNSCLEALDLSSNRLTREAFRHILDGLSINTGLRTLTMKGNPITTAGVMDFVQTVLNLPAGKEAMTKLELIDFSDVCVGQDFTPLYTEIRRKRNLCICHGPLLQQDDIRRVIDLSTVIHSEQPAFILFDCMKKSNLRLKDIFYAFDKDKSNSLTRDDFKRGLLSMNVPLSSRALDLLIKRIDSNNDGEVSLTELLALQKDFIRYISRRKGSTDGMVQSAFRRVKVPRPV